MLTIDGQIWSAHVCFYHASTDGGERVQCILYILVFILYALYNIHIHNILYSPIICIYIYYNIRRIWYLYGCGISPTFDTAERFTLMRSGQGTSSIITCACLCIITCLHIRIMIIYYILLQLTIILWYEITLCTLLWYIYIYILIITYNAEYTDRLPSLSALCEYITVGAGGTGRLQL